MVLIDLKVLINPEILLEHEVPMDPEDLVNHKVVMEEIFAWTPRSFFFNKLQ